MVPPSCAYFPVSALCLAPLLRSLPPCGQHLWVNTGHGWNCVPEAPAPPPACQPPWTFPILVSRSWQCLGGPGPVIRPMPGKAPPAAMPQAPIRLLAARQA
jgi:hypothetical protein